MLSRTSEYALQAMIYLAQHADQGPTPVGVIAGKTGIPSKYLSAILSALARQGLLHSARGKRGGFSLARDPREITLMEVLARFERFEVRRCPFMNQECSDEHPCMAHEQWKQVVAAQRQFLTNATIHDVAMPTAPAGRKRSSRKPPPASKPSPGMKRPSRRYSTSHRENH